MRSCRISPVRKRGKKLLGGVLSQPLDEPHHVNGHSLMGAGANGRDTLCRFDLELNAATIDLGRSLRKGLIALRAAFSMAMIMTGVANTGGKVASLKRLARCSAVTTSVNEPLGPTGTDAMRLFLGTCYAARTVHNEPCTAPPAKAAGCFPEENAPLIS